MHFKEKLRCYIRKLAYGAKADSDSYVKYLKSLGMKIGERTTFYAPNKTQIDTTRPWLIEIGNDVSITEGVTILTHGYDWSVLKGVYGDVLGSSGSVSIGNNVFIGMQTTILKGVHIGDNVIIGANSLVNKNIPNNVVAAGNPCKVIMTLDEYHEKRKLTQLDEARELVYKFRECYGKEPDEQALHEFFWLFSDGNALPECWDRIMKLGGNYQVSYNMLKNQEKPFDGMKDFLEKI